MFNGLKKSLITYGSIFFVLGNQAFTQEDHQLMVELKNLKNTLSSQELSLSKLAHLKSLEKQMNEEVHKEMNHKNALIQEYSTLTQKTLKGSQGELGWNERIKYEIQKRKLSNQLLDKNKKVESLQAQLQQTKHKFQNLKKVFRKHDYETTLTVTQMGEHIRQLTQSLNNRGPQPSQARQQTQKLINQKMETLSELRKLQGELDTKTRNIAHYKEELNLKQQAYDELVKVNQKLSLALLKSERKIDYLVRKNTELETKVARIQSEKSSLERYTENLERDSKITQTRLEGAVASLKSSQNRYPSRAPASLEPQEKTKLMDHFKKAKFRLKEFDEDRVGLVIDDYYLFESGSARINELSKAKLFHLITLYTEEFLSPSFNREILSIDFIGHASPRYKSQYVDPLKASDEAYQYNLNLSLKRAQSLAKTLLSSDFGDFPHKEKFRSKIQVIGKSFGHPVPLRSPAQTQSSSCGAFDCQKSQRVEIVFKLGPTKK